MRCQREPTVVDQPSFRIDSQTLELIAESVRNIAKALRMAPEDGYSLPNVEICRLKNHDAIKLNGPMAKTYIEYPLPLSPHPLVFDTEGRLSPNLVMIDGIIQHLHENLWRSIRETCLKKAVGLAKKVHQDASPAARWAYTFCANGNTHCFEKGNGLETIITTIVSTPLGPVTISSDHIVLPVVFPDTVMTSLPFKTVGEVISLPSSGTPTLDSELGNQLIFSAVRADKTTILSISKGWNRPLVDGSTDGTWRALRRAKIAGCLRSMPLAKHGKLEYRVDLEKTAAVYHRACADELAKLDETTNAS